MGQFFTAQTSINTYKSVMAIDSGLSNCQGRVQGTIRALTQKKFKALELEQSFFKNTMNCIKKVSTDIINLEQISKNALIAMNEYQTNTSKFFTLLQTDIANSHKEISIVENSYVRLMTKVLELHKTIQKQVYPFKKPVVWLGFSIFLLSLVLSFYLASRKDLFNKKVRYGLNRDIKKIKNLENGNLDLNQINNILGERLPLLSLSFVSETVKKLSDELRDFYQREELVSENDHDLKFINDLYIKKENENRTISMEHRLETINKLNNLEQNKKTSEQLVPPIPTHLIVSDQKTCLAESLENVLEKFNHFFMASKIEMSLDIDESIHVSCDSHSAYNLFYFIIKNGLSTCDKLQRPLASKIKLVSNGNFISFQFSVLSQEHVNHQSKISSISSSKHSLLSFSDASFVKSFFIKNNAFNPIIADNKLVGQQAVLKIYDNGAFYLEAPRQNLNQSISMRG